MTVQTQTEREAPSSEEGGGATYRLDDSPVHGRTVNGLEAAGLGTASEVLELFGPEADRIGATATLTNVDGVGSTGASQVVDWLESEGLWSPEGESSEPTDDAAYPLDDSPADGPTLEALDRAGLETADDVIEYVGENRWFPDAEIDLASLDGMTRSRARNVVDWLREEVGWKSDDEPSEDGEGLYEIRCPHCGDLFERHSADENPYENGMARCKTDMPHEDLEFEAGDCGEMFWLEWTGDGYETFASPPEGAETSGSPSNSTETSDDPEDEGSEASETSAEDTDQKQTYHLLWTGEGVRHRVWKRLLCRDRTGAEQPERFDERCRYLEQETEGVLLDRVVLASSPEEAWREVEPEVEGEWYGATDLVDEPLWAKSGADEENADPPHREPEDINPYLYPDHLDEEGEAENETPKEDTSDSFWPDETDEPPREQPEPPAVPPAERVHPDLPDCRPLGSAEVDSEAWHHLRSQGIGSSDAGPILGFSEHATPQDIWASKVDGEEVDDKPWLEAFAQFGTWFESYIREWCEREYGATILPGKELGTLQSVRWERALANIDGLDTSSGVIEEIKTTSSSWTSPPEDYEAQVQHQMYVTGAREARIRQFICPVPRDVLPSLLERIRDVCLVEEEADRTLAEWLLERGEVETWIVERDDAFISSMIERERDFWEYVTQAVPPPEADPEGTVDLSDEPEVFASVKELAEARAQKEEVDDVIDREDDAKSRAREAIEETVALMDETPKRIKVGPHKATLVERDAYSYWRIYPDTEAESTDFWPDEGGQ